MYIKKIPGKLSISLTADLITRIIDPINNYLLPAIVSYFVVFVFSL